MINLKLQDKATSDGRAKCAHAKSAKTSQPCAEQSQWQWVRNDRACVAQRAHRAYRSRPPQLVPQQLSGTVLRAGMGDHEWRYGDPQTTSAYCFSHSIVVGEVLQKRSEAADRGERFVAQRNRRSETRTRDAKLDAKHGAGQEMIVDRQGGQT